MEVIRKAYEFKFNEIQKTGAFDGLASIFNIVDADKDVMAPAAFDETLNEKKTYPLLWQHSVLEPIGIAEPKPAPTGLATKGEFIMEVQRAREAYALAKAGAVTGLSVGFEILDDEPNDKGGRFIKKARLWEISLAVFPACPGAGITDIKQIEPDFERKPYANEHAARLIDPNKCDPKTFRRKADGTIYGHIKVPETIDVIWAKLKTANKPSDYPVPQALRFPAEKWTAAEARAWLKKNDIEPEEFMAAGKSLDRAIEILTANLSDINLKLDARELMTLKHLTEALTKRQAEAGAAFTPGGAAGSQDETERALELLKRYQAELRKKIL